MSYLGARNAVSLGVSYQATLGGPNLLNKLAPSLLLNFAGATALDPRITFTRSTTATFTGSNGLIQSAAINAARFDYNPTTLAPLGLLIEEQRVNLVTYSEQFDNAAWTKTNVSVTANSTTAPDATTTADTLNEGTATASHSCHQAPTLTASTTYTISCFIKTVSAGFAGLAINTTSSNNYGSVEFNLAGAGSVNRTSVLGTGFAIVSSSITAVGNNWFRCVATITLGSATVADPRATVYMSDGSGSFDTRGRVTYTGTNKTLFAWGAQLEAGAFATSYIPTVASQVTRTADVAVMTGTNFSSWFNAPAGTFAATYEASPNTFTSYLVASNGVTAQNSIHFDNDSGNMRAVYYSGSSAVATLSLGARGTVGTVNKVASAYSVNDFAAARNAGSVVTDTAGAVPVSLTQLNIGADPSGAAVNVMNTHIRQIAYYPRRLSNAELQGITR